MADPWRESATVGSWLLLRGALHMLHRARARSCRRSDRVSTGVVAMAHASAMAHVKTSGYRASLIRARARVCRERVQVQGVGMYLMGVYPGAFVDLNSEQLAALPARRQLRVVAAGVWHNAVLVVVCAALMRLFPLLQSPLHTSTAAIGAVVQAVDQVRDGR